MGVLGLTTFVNKNYHWRSIRVPPGSKIVIDGYSLCYPLYGSHKWQFGGDYREFYDTVSSYFQHLVTDLKIDPYVIIDGIDCNNHKSATSISRIKQRLTLMSKEPSKGDSILPLFAKSVFVDVLRDMSLMFYIADGEADRDIVSLANRLCCPVLGNDSDYFIFNIEQGYIPICGDSNSVVDLGGEVKLFSYKEFDTQFSLHTTELRLYLPVFLGNDFHCGHSSPKLGIGVKMKVEEVVDKISKITDERCDMNIFKSKEEDSHFYKIAPESFTALSTSSFLSHHNPGAVPGWMLDLYRKGLFLAESMSFLAIPSPKVWKSSLVIENVRVRSAWEFVESIRPYIIGALLSGTHCDVSEVVHINTAPPFVFDVKKVILKRKHLELLPVHLRDVPQIPKDERKMILLRVFHCKRVAKSIKGIPERLVLAVIASRCWLQKLEDHKDEEVKRYVCSLVCCILSCSGDLDIPKEGELPPFPTEDRLAFVHTFAQWQCMLHCVIALNQVLSHPYEYTSPGKLFSGSTLLYFYLKDLRVLKRIVESNMLAKLLVHVVTKDVLQNPDSAVSRHGATPIPTTNKFQSLQVAIKRK